MHEAMVPTRDPAWVLSHEGYSILSESAIESRFALGNGFLGARAARSVSRGPTWVSWLGYIKWASWPRCYVAGRRAYRRGGFNWSSQHDLVGHPVRPKTDRALPHL